jgi:hypothetical protein
MPTLAPPPMRHELSTKLPEGGSTITRPWARWLTQELGARLEKAPLREAHVALSGQAASIGTTAFPLAAVAPGIYRVSYTLRVTLPGGTSGSVSVSVLWTSGGLAQQVSGSPATGNTTTTVQSGVVLVRSDNVTPISYATTYASAGSPAMEYSIDLVIEALALD